MNLFHPEDSSAVLSTCGLYRYQLWRRWSAAPLVAFVMLNPSTADAEQDDPTIRRCIGFAKSWGLGGLGVLNLFALRSTDPKKLYTAADPVGPDNDKHISESVVRCQLVVAAWGTHGALNGRGIAVRRLLKPLTNLRMLGLTKDGHPKHPLYLAGATEAKPWSEQ